jgi:predicted ArsR family transcriptional regulator
VKSRPKPEKPEKVDKREKADKPEPITSDAMVHDRIRLAILTTLAAHDVRSFTELRDALSVTDGNLLTHLRRLEDAGYLGSRKDMTLGRSRSSFRITRQGRSALLRYVEEMERALSLARSAVQTSATNAANSNLPIPTRTV